MYAYSPIKTLYIKNFRNLGEVVIDFSKSPIVSLVGENEAGKTSTIKAFATCALNAKAREQKDYIRQGTNMFGVAIDLEDGTRITRIKEASGINSYQVAYPDGKKWSTTKITDGLPVQVQELMGLIEEPETGEFLHIRTYEDKLLFVVTPNSTNYKVMYNALKVEQLTKAIKQGSTEANDIKSLINQNANSAAAFEEQLRTVVIHDITPLISVRDRLRTQLSLISTLEKANKLNESVELAKVKIGAIGLIDKLQLKEINEASVVKLSRISNILNSYSIMNNWSKIYSQLSSVSSISIDEVVKLEKLKNLSDQQSVKISRASMLSTVSEFCEISEVAVVHLIKLKQYMNLVDSKKNSLDKLELGTAADISDARLEIYNKAARARNCLADIADKKKQLDTYNNAIVEINDILKKSGIAVESCPKCGEAVVFDLDKLNANGVNNE